jgi:hypothetical protein
VRGLERAVSLGVATTRGPSGELALEGPLSLAELMTLAVTMAKDTLDGGSRRNDPGVRRPRSS